MSNGRDGVFLDVRGLNEVIEALDAYTDDIKKKAVRSALRVETRPFVRAIRANLSDNIRFGLLKRSIGVKFKNYRRGAVQYVAIGPRTGFRFAGAFLVGNRAVVGDPANYAHLVEYDTQPHAIGKGAQVGGGTRSGAARRRVVRGGMHPGTTGIGFMRKAFDVHGRGVTNAVVRRIASEAERIAQKIAARRRRT